MPLHLLGWVATALLAGHVCVRPEARQLATALLLAGLASLLAHYHEEVEGFRRNFGASVNEALGAPLFALAGAASPP